MKAQMVCSVRDSTMDKKEANQCCSPVQRALAVQWVASKIGFDWSDIDGVLDKVSEELEEMREARNKGDFAHMRDELGDLFFASISVARFLEIDPDACIENATKRFEKRMNEVEKLALEQGRDLATCTAASLDDLWEQAKALASQ